MYITRKNLETHGFTAGCPACDNTRLGRRSGGILHTDACRKRMEATLSQDPEAQDRYERALMKHVAYHEPPAPTMPSAGAASAPARVVSTSPKPMVMARQPPLHQALGVAAAPAGGEVRSTTSTKRPPPEAEEARAVRSKEAPVQAQKRKHEGGGEEIEEAGYGSRSCSFFSPPSGSSPTWKGRSCCFWKRAAKMLSRLSSRRRLSSKTPGLCVKNLQVWSKTVTWKPSLTMCRGNN